MTSALRYIPRTVIACVSVLGLPPAAAQAADKVDVIVLQNGSRIVGEVKSMRRSRLELSTDDMGTIQIEWGNVAQVTAPEFFEVEAMDGRLNFGSLRPGADGLLEVVNILGPIKIPLSEVARIQLVKAGFWQRIDGSIDVGLGYTSATELLQFSGNAQVRYRRPKFEATAEGDAVLTRQPDADDTQRSSVTAGYARLFPNRQRIFTQVTAEQNQELGFDLRASVIGGWATFLARDDGNELLGGAGLAVNRELPVDGEKTTNAEALLALQYTNFAYDFPNTDIQVGTQAFFGLNQWGRVRLEVSGRLKREIFTDFYVGLNGYDSYDSDPATAGAQKNDWGLNLSIGWKF